MTELNHTTFNYNQQRLLIQRVLGFKELVPGSAKWTLYTHAHDECRHCNQSVLTIFLWNPRLG